MALAFQNGLRGHNSDLRILNGNNFSILCINLVAFDSVVAEFTRVKILTFGTAVVDQQWS